MKLRSLTLLTMAVLSVFAFSLEPATAKAKNRRPSCDQFSSLQCAASPGVYRHTNYSGKSSGNGDVTEFFQMLGAACAGGGVVLTVAQVAGAAATGPIGWGVGGACLLQQLIGLGMPPPKPLVINMPNKTKVINVDLSDPKIQEFFRQHPEIFQKIPSAPAEPVLGADTPMSKAPVDPKTNPPVAQTPAPPSSTANVPTPVPALNPKKEADKPVPPVEMPKVKVPAGPQQDAQAVVGPTKVEYGPFDPRKQH